VTYTTYTKEVDMLARPGFFEEIDTEEKAYFLGFLTADGYVGWTPKRYAYVVEIGLQGRDRDVIDKFQRAVGSTHKVQDRVVNGSVYPRLHIKSKRLAGSLRARGLCPKTGDVPTGIPSELMHHFFRGWFDGDGSVFRCGQGRFRLSVCGARPIVEAFAAFCYPTVKRHYPVIDHSKSPICYYRLGGRQGLRVLEVLYDGSSVWLDRKHQVFKELQEHFGNKPLSSNYIGVSYNKAKKKFDAKIRFAGKQIHIGRFLLEEDAARARDAFVVAHNLTRELNFPEDLQDGQ
jgi:hypothetical protein